MSEDTHRLTGDNHYHRGDRLRTGDTFAPSERELAAFGFKFEALDGAGGDHNGDNSDGESDDVDSDAGDVPDDLDSMAYSELQSLAKDRGIKANKSTEDLIAAIREG